MLLREQLTSADVMTIDPVAVAADATIEEAEDLIRRYRISGLPVTDTNGALVGVISQTDFVHLANPEVARLIHNKTRGIRVGEVMSRPPVTVDLGTPLIEAARVMVTENIHRVVVVGGGQRPIGVLSAMDFVNLYATEPELSL